MSAIAILLEKPFEKTSRFNGGGKIVGMPVQIGSEITKIWANFDDKYLQLNQGDKIEVYKAGQTWKVNTNSIPAASPQRAAQTQFQTATPQTLVVEKESRREEIRKHRFALSRLWLDCYNDIASSNVCANLGLSDDAIRSGATSVFIQTCKSKNL